MSDFLRQCGSLYGDFSVLYKVKKNIHETLNRRSQYAGYKSVIYPFAISSPNFVCPYNFDMHFNELLNTFLMETLDSSVN